MTAWFWLLSGGLGTAVVFGRWLTVLRVVAKLMRSVAVIVSGIAVIVAFPARLWRAEVIFSLD